MLPGFFNPILAGGSATADNGLFGLATYTSTGGQVTVPNGLAMSSYGGTVLIKNRSGGPTITIDSTTGLGYEVGIGDSTNYSIVSPPHAFSATGFRTSSAIYAKTNLDIGNNYISWAWRKDASYHNSLAYTGDGGYVRTIYHGMNVVPGLIVVKKNTGTEDFAVAWHAGLTTGTYIYVGATYPQQTYAPKTFFGNYNTTVEPTSSTVTISLNGAVNAYEQAYTMYVWGNDGVNQKHGSFTTNSSGAGTVTLNFKPRAVLWRPRHLTANWYMIDSLRGVTKNLEVNTVATEGTVTNPAITFTDTGFTFSTSTTSLRSQTMIYSAWK